MIRVYDPEVVRQALLLYPFEEIECDVEECLLNDEAIILSDGEGSLGIFEAFLPYIYTGHYFFKVRGRDAKELAIQMLQIIFGHYEARAVRGLTPRKHKAAHWMTRHLGFKAYGEIETKIGPCTIYVMTRDEFNSLHSEEKA